MRTRLAAAAGAAVIAAWTGGFSGSAAAAVTGSGAGGFQVVETVAVKAPPKEVWKVLVQPKLWWNSAHTWSGSANNLSLAARPGGCFCEKLPDGGVEHLRVVYVKPESELHLAGGLGPLQFYAVGGSMVVRIVPDGSGSKLSLTYSVGGWTSEGLADWGPKVDGVLAEQVTRLARTVDTGKPD